LDKSLSYTKFSYNNSYQESLKMASFEMLYGYRCRTLFVAKPVVTAMGVANRAKVNQLDASQGSEVPVGNEFPDVFP
jgi:hypothetical protein